jgi:hypothetical protein
MVGDDLEKHPDGAPLPAPRGPCPSRAGLTHGVHNSVLPCCPCHPTPPRLAAASLRPLFLDGEIVAAQDGPG